MKIMIVVVVSLVSLSLIASERDLLINATEIDVVVSEDINITVPVFNQILYVRYGKFSVHRPVRGPYCRIVLSDEGNDRTIERGRETLRLRVAEPSGFRGHYLWLNFSNEMSRAYVSYMYIANQRIRHLDCESNSNYGNLSFAYVNRLLGDKINLRPRTFRNPLLGNTPSVYQDEVTDWGRAYNPLNMHDWPSGTPPTYGNVRER